METVRALLPKEWSLDFEVTLIVIDRKHGTFRPRLLSLVSSNEEALIQSTTGKAYTLYDDHRDGSIPTDALDTLTALKGIGPATASLLLAVYDPVAAPFFSDELFRWLTGADATSAGKPQGWDKKIGYTKKEYKELWERVTQLRHRIEGVGGGEDGVTATDLEKAAYVIARWHISGGEPEASGTRNAKRPREVDDGAEEAVEEKLARRKSARSK